MTTRDELNEAKKHYNVHLDILSNLNYLLLHEFEKKFFIGGSRMINEFLETFRDGRTMLMLYFDIMLKIAYVGLQKQQFIENL